MKLHWVELPIKVPSRKNNYRIHRRKRRSWIAPAEHVQLAEENIGFLFKNALPDLKGTLCLVTWCYRGMDTDNALGSIYEGLQKSGRISNDRVIRTGSVFGDQVLRENCIVCLAEIPEGQDYCRFLLSMLKQIEKEREEWV